MRIDVGNKNILKRWVESFKYGLDWWETGINVPENISNFGFKRCCPGNMGFEASCEVGKYAVVKSCGNGW